MELSKDMLDGFVAQLVELDGKAVKASGTVTERKRQALEAVTEAEKVTIANSGLQMDDLEVSLYPVTYLDRITAELETLKVAHEEAKQAVEDAIVATLKAQKADTGAELATIRTERETLVNTIKAMSLLLGVEVEIPKAPKGASSNGSSTPRAKSSTGSHYVKAEDGTVTSYANDTFSGLAFYAFKRAGVGDLKAALQANGITELSKPWEATVTVNEITRTIGHRVEVDSTEG